jgi:hypothetical protein
VIGVDRIEGLAGEDDELGEDEEVDENFSELEDQVDQEQVDQDQDDQETTNDDDDSGEE